MNNIMKSSSPRDLEGLPGWQVPGVCLSQLLQKRFKDRYLERERAGDLVIKQIQWHVPNLYRVFIWSTTCRQSNTMPDRDMRTFARDLVNHPTISSRLLHLETTYIKTNIDLSLKFNTTYIWERDLERAGKLQTLDDNWWRFLPELTQFSMKFRARNDRFMKVEICRLWNLA